MFRPHVLVSLLAVALMAVGLLSGDDKKDSPKDTPVKAKGQLPPNWGKLSLDAEQKQTIYKIQGEYRAKIGPLEQQIKKLRQEEKKELEMVLTDAQKARLREILTGKAPADTKNDKKPEKDK